MATGKTLTEYHRKRDFARTPEPEGRGGRDPDGEPRFVVRIHDAGTRHFDVRLAVDGVLKSRAVPKRPSGASHDKRLAVPTEDHRWSTRTSRASSGRASTAGGP